MLTLFAVYSSQYQVEHEEWWQQLEFYKKRRRDLLRDWSRDRAELLNRVAVTFNEATLAVELSEVKQQYREQQEDICEQLYQQVCMFFS